MTFLQTDKRIICTEFKDPEGLAVGDFFFANNITSFQINNLHKESKARRVELESFNNTFRSHMYELFKTSESRIQQLRNLIAKKNHANLRVERSQNETLVQLLKEKNTSCTNGMFSFFNELYSRNSYCVQQNITIKFRKKSIKFSINWKCEVSGMYFKTTDFEKCR